MQSSISVPSSSTADGSSFEEWTKLLALYRTSRSPETQRDVLLGMGALVERILHADGAHVTRGSGNEVISGFLSVVRDACHPAESVSTRSAGQQALNSSGVPPSA